MKLNEINVVFSVRETLRKTTNINEKSCLHDQRWKIYTKKNKKKNKKTKGIVAFESSWTWLRDV